MLSEILSLWKEVLVDSRTVFVREKSNASLLGGIKHISFSYLMIGFIVGIAVALISYLIPLPKEFSFLRFVGFAAILFVPILLILASVLGSLFSTGVLFLIAKLFGGEREFLGNNITFTAFFWRLFP